MFFKKVFFSTVPAEMSEMKMNRPKKGVILTKQRMPWELVRFLCLESPPLPRPGCYWIRGGETLRWTEQLRTSYETFFNKVRGLMTFSRREHSTWRLGTCTRVISRRFTATLLLKTILRRGHLPRLSVTAKIST